MTASRKLYRSNKNRVFFGVCGGIGEFFEIDPVIVRIIFVILAIWAGGGLILYIILLFLIPEEPSKGEKSSEDVKERVESTAQEIKDRAEEFAEEIKKNVKDNPSRIGADQLFGLIVILIGAAFLFGNFFPFLAFGKLWPLILIIVGLAILVGAEKGRK